MKIEDYISNDFKAISIETPINKVIKAMKGYPFSHFIITESNKLVGLLALEDLVDLDNSITTIQELHYTFQYFQTGAPSNKLDLIGLFAQYNTSILPLIDKNNTYLGYFELSEILQYFNTTPFFKQNTTTLIVEKGNHEYSLSEISQIVESNDITLLGLFVSKTNSTDTQITLKLDTENPNEVIQSLRRYNYHVLTNAKDDVLLEQLRERAEYLKRYLAI